MFFTWFAFFDEVLAIRFYGWPEVTGVKDSGSHSVCVGMVAANAFMQLLNDVLRLFCSDTFEKRLAISAFVKIIAYHGIFGGLIRPSFVSIWWGGCRFGDIGYKGWSSCGLGDG